MNKTLLMYPTWSRLLACFWVVLFLSSSVSAQNDEKPSTPPTIDQDATGRIVIEAHGLGKIPEPKVIYTASSKAKVNVGETRIEQEIEINAKVLQGKATMLSLGINGDGEITNVRGEGLQSWSVRREGESRFLDLSVNEGVTELNVNVNARSVEYELPSSIVVTHLSPGAAIGFSSEVEFVYATNVQGKVTDASGFAPLGSPEPASRYQTTTGGQLTLSLGRRGAAPGPAEIVDTTLEGVLHDNGGSMQFELRGRVLVTHANAEITILKGNAAISEVPVDPHYRLRLTSENGQNVYKMIFLETGDFPIALDFVATLSSAENARRSLDFTIAGGAVVPLTLEGLGGDIEFQREPTLIVPQRRDDAWIGFLPASGHAKLAWKPSRSTGEGKLFFTTTGQIEASVGAGLMRQNHSIVYQILQGELKSVQMRLHGPGEILDVSGTNIVGWQTNGEGDQRLLEITLSQPVTSECQFLVRSQTTFDDFPVRVEGLRVDPIGAIRHSGFLRVINSGSVRFEPVDLLGLTQLSPDQYPGEASGARQVFVYRFPAGEHRFSIDADRVQPEVNVSQLIVYGLSETDRMMTADIELDIREAAIREWDFSIPSDYSIVAVTGAAIADYVAASDVNEGRRNLKVIFSQEVIGRQLVTFTLEKSEAAAAGDWVLPRLGYPDAKTVRGDIGITATAGFRISMGATDWLVEKPLSYFPKPTANLQQAFRIRQPEWSATMRIELLDRSVQSDVFHLYSLSDETIYGSVLINYFVTGSPVSEWRISVPESLGNVMVDGQDVRTWRRDGDTLIVSLHQPVMGPCTLLVTFEEKTDATDQSFSAGLITPMDVQGERGYLHIVSPMQVEIQSVSISDELLRLDPLELPAELRLLSTAPSLGTWQYTERPFVLNLKVNWFHPGTMVTQVVEFAEANSRVSADGELVTDITYFLKSRGGRSLRLKLPSEPARLWEVSVNGEPVTARAAEDSTLIPLPGGSDPNEPVQVQLRVGKPAVSESHPQLELPTVDAPVLKMQWNVTGDEKHALLPTGGTVSPPIPVSPPSGFAWVVRNGIGTLVLIAALVGLAIGSRRRSGVLQFAAMASVLISLFLCLLMVDAAMADRRPPLPLQLSLPILAAGEPIVLNVANTPMWWVNFSWLGAFAMLGGVAAMVFSFTKENAVERVSIRSAGMFLFAIGLLCHGDAAGWFYALLALFIAIFLLVPLAHQLVQRGKAWSRQRRQEKSQPSVGDSIGPATSLVIGFVFAITTAGSSFAAVPDGFQAADSISQEWKVTHEDDRLAAIAKIAVTGKPGDQFVLLHAPAVLTQFDGKGLRLTKSEIPGIGMAYVVSIPLSDEKAEQEVVSEKTASTSAKTISANAFEANFEYQLEAVHPRESVPVLTGDAAVATIRFHYDESGWEVRSPTAVRIESVEADDSTQAAILLGPGDASVSLQPTARDVSTETTKYFVEASNLYLPGPGVIDGRHRFQIRTSQGEVRQLRVSVASGLTVSSVNGPVGAWQFDADSGELNLQIEPAQSDSFQIEIETQRGLDPLPADATLRPLRVQDAAGEVGLVAIAFGADAQPEKITANGMSVVNLGDFDAGMLPGNDAVLHRVVRYGADGGELIIRVAPVAPEVRVLSQQVLSLGDERVVLNVNFTAEITRAGLFQLSFPLPVGLEVESLSGPSLHHWAERTEGDQREIVLHLNGKTIGTQTFVLTLSGPTPNEIREWELPRFELNEATRQSGELIVRPTTGIRLRTVTRHNVSEIDSRSVSNSEVGSLAFRLLQKDWNLTLGIEKLDPWVTGQVLHAVSLREGQTRTTLVANFDVQNASIRQLEVVLPIEDADEIKTLRASGDTVSDLVRTGPNTNTWVVEFKRRVVGKVEFKIEYERRGDRVDDSETLTPVKFPEARQTAYYFAVRAGGRLELEHDELPDGWQRADWNSVPSPLRDAESRGAPVLTVRSVSTTGSLVIHAKRHSLADALKLRVAKGTLTTVVSPAGDQLTAVELTVDVIQRSNLSVRLPDEGVLFNIFVNGESVNSIRQGGEGSPWQFTILPGIDDRTAMVRFVYSVTGRRISDLELTSPELNVPLENIEWNVIAPKGFELTDHDGSLELVRQSNQQQYDRNSYLKIVQGRRQAQAEQATELLEQANELLQAGEQSKAGWALNSVANRYALDAASNEDARVQLENLQTQQAIVGLNTRRQRLYLDNRPDEGAAIDNQQFRNAAADNPILQTDQMNFRPGQLSELLRGNTTSDNAVLQRIAARLVRHQRTSQPAPQAILISLPEEGVVYTFGRSVQVTENAPLKLELEFAHQQRLGFWKSSLVLIVLAILAATLAITRRPTLARE
ncbi:hypothetical protein [Neorhodopirellula pilleata]|uniref:Uncharacterized protein n=1 Tax=Neorhodopirellula pilleata TaxID=2714738 RepID=A0A5C6APY7_9BACT|nr:hypothetical protein [Neorhodopirellula pilleata]TWU01598.1 hypothetical protein Pla100_13330 [Neorhodopirellula pilleata]